MYVSYLYYIQSMGQFMLLHKHGHELSFGFIKSNSVLLVT